MHSQVQPCFQESGKASVRAAINRGDLPAPLQALTDALVLAARPAAPRTSSSACPHRGLRAIFAWIALSIRYLFFLQRLFSSGLPGQRREQGPTDDWEREAKVRARKTGGQRSNLG